MVGVLQHEDPPFGVSPACRAPHGANAPVGWRRGRGSGRCVTHIADHTFGHTPTMKQPPSMFIVDHQQADKSPHNQHVFPVNRAYELSAHHWRHPTVETRVGHDHSVVPHRYTHPPCSRGGIRLPPARANRAGGVPWSRSDDYVLTRPPLPSYESEGADGGTPRGDAHP